MNQRIYYKNIVLILAASFFYMACPMLITPLITGFAESLGAVGTIMGIIGGLMNVCSLICRPIAGSLADKISKYKLSFIGAAFMTFACIGYIAAHGAVVLVIARILHGIGFSCCSVCMSTWMANMLPKEKVGSGMGIYGTMNALAMAITPAIGIKLYDAFGYKTAFALAIFFSVSIAIIIQFVTDKGEPNKAVKNDRIKLQLVDKNVIPVALIIMLFTLPYCATQSFLVKYVEVRNLNISASLFFPLYAAALLILRVALKNFFDKWKFSTFMTISAACSLASLLCLTYANNNFIMFLAAIFMAGSYGIMCSVAQSTAILLADKGKEGLANSTYYIGLDLGMALGPIIGGLLYEKISILFFYPILMFTIPLCFIVWLVTHIMRKHMKQI